ncbi:MAG TPA: hypothetical protein VFK41_10960 [Nocardioidaceae bacterium]|nr:hypothetical protein [Nocardioidaceae bacterium]
MDEGDRFFGEDDPEWAVSQLAAQVAATAKVRRRVSWHIVLGSVLTTVLVVGAFVLGLTSDEPSEPLADPQPTDSEQSTPVEPPRARRVTLSPLPTPTPVPTSTVTVVVTSPAPTPEPPPPSPDDPETPPNQVGPNRPITTPIDPDDR